MDTRTKIVSSLEASRIAGQGATVVIGYFDPMLASHADQLKALKQTGHPLLVAIADPEHPILPTRARAELVAGLAVVDHVVESASSLKPDADLRAGHDRKLDQLIQHVQSRQRAAS